MTNTDAILSKLAHFCGLRSLRTRSPALILAMFVLVVTAATAANAQTFSTLFSFDGTHGLNPHGPLIQGRDGNFYGTTYQGGTGLCSDSTGCGTVFTITPAGTLTTLYNFFCDPAWWCLVGPIRPEAGLVQAPDGNFYGTGSGGGSSNRGEVFAITPTGTLTDLYSMSCDMFYCTEYPTGELVQSTDGSFFGTTFGTGMLSPDNGVGERGTVFKITPSGSWSLVYTFCLEPDCPDGAFPHAGLVQATDGNFYGTTSSAAKGYGTVFKVTPGGALTTLHSFNSTDGASPVAELVQATDGNFYGTTSGGGSGYGTVFKITPKGRLTSVHSFDNTDGATPLAGLIQATDGNIYGTTVAGGAYGWGTVFKITPQGALTTLHNFDNTQTSGAPVDALVQATDGSFYGTTAYAEWYRYGGMVFKIDTGLGPFVKLARDSGKVGATGGILGQGLTGTTSVSVNGTPASFSVESDTFLTATVPAGATTGFVTVTTQSGTLTSNKPLRVRPQFLSFNPPSGPVGTQVKISGFSLTQTTGVGFGDYVSASFTVDSDTQVTATVPTGAKTGKVGIQTLGGTAISSGTFTVTP